MLPWRSCRAMPLRVFLMCFSNVPIRSRLARASAVGLPERNFTGI